MNNFITEDQMLNRKLAVEALRTEPEALRACNILQERNEKGHMVCAVALIALKLGMDLSVGTTTQNAVQFVADAMGLDMQRNRYDLSSPAEDLLSDIIHMNDTIKGGCTGEPVYTWREIGDRLEEGLKAL